MGAKARAATVTATDADVAAWTAVLDLARRFGPDRAAAAALYASGTPLWPYLLLAAARNTTVDDVVQVLRLGPGELAAIAGVSLPAPASPVPPDEATVFPADDDDDPDPAPGPYATRMRLVLLRELPEPTAAALASLVPGRVGVILYMIARGDAVADVAEVLHLSIDEVDAVLDHAAGRHISRPLG
jgi:hypothetical protein